MKAWLALLLLVTAPALGGENRFPQSVRVGDLIGQKLIGAIEAQPLLGHVEAVDRLADGGLVLRIRRFSLVPWRGGSVTVPLNAVSFLGPEVALTGLTSAQFDALPSAGTSAVVPAGETIQIGLVKPFH